MEKKTLFKGKIAATLLGGVGAYLATLAALGGFGKADATFREVPSSLCHTKNDTYGANLENAGAFNNFGTSAVPIYCPIESDNTVQAGAINALSVYGKEGADGGYSAACACYLDPVTCSCPSITNWANTTGGRVASLTGAAVSEWNNGRVTKYRWLLHNLTGSSALVGFTVSTP